MQGTAQTPVVSSAQLAGTLSQMDLRSAMLSSPEVMAALSITGGKFVGLRYEIVDWRTQQNTPRRKTVKSDIPQTKFEAFHRLLRRPNPKFPTYALCMRRGWTDYMIGGRAAFEIETIDGTPSGMPVGLWNIPTDQLRPGPRKLDGSLVDPKVAWIQRVNGKDIPLREDQVLVICRQPSYEMSGESSLRVLADTIEARRLVEARMRLDFSTQGYGVRRVMNFPGRNQGWLDMLAEKLRTRFAITSGNASLSILTNSDIAPTVHAMTDNNQQMELLGYLEEISRQICNYFHVSKLELNYVLGSNRSTSQTQHQMSLQGGAKGDYETWEDALSTLARRFHPFLSFEFPDLDSLDPATEWDVILKMLHVFTIDEVRAMKFNYDPLPDGEGSHVATYVEPGGEAVSPSGRRKSSDPAMKADERMVPLDDLFAGRSTNGRH